MLDCLIVVEDSDTIKRCVYEIKDILQNNSKLRKIDYRSIYDQRNEKGHLRCNKLLFMLEEQNGLRQRQVLEWANSSPAIKGKRDKYCVIFACKENQPISTAERSTEERSNHFVHSYNDILSWWPVVLPFLTETVPGWAIFRYSRRRSYYLEDLRTASAHTQVYGIGKDKLVSFLRTTKTTSSELENSDCVIILCDTLDFTLATENRKLLRKLKTSGRHVYFVSQNSENPSADVKWAATFSFPCSESLKFVTHLLADLKIIAIQIEELCIISRPKGPKSLKVSHLQTGVELTWDDVETANEAVTSQNLVIKQRDDTSKAWKTIIEVSAYANCSRQEIQHLSKKRSYQFALIVQNNDGDSVPVLSKWLSMDDRQTLFVRLLYKTGLWLSFLVTVLLAIVVGMFVIVTFALSSFAIFVYTLTQPREPSTQELLERIYLLGVFSGSLVWIYGISIGYFARKNDITASEIISLICIPVIGLIWGCGAHLVFRDKPHYHFIVFVLPVRIWEKIVEKEMP